jgi:endonuclease/exonuclease/phosphatase family metal-dependent hydrolase
MSGKPSRATPKLGSGVLHADMVALAIAARPLLAAPDMLRLLRVSASCLALVGCASLPPERIATADERQSRPVAEKPTIDGVSTTLDVLTFNVEGLPWPARGGRAPALKKIGTILAQLNRRGEAPDVILVQEMFSRAAIRAMSHAGYRYRAWGPSRTQRKALPARGRVAAGRRWDKGETGFHLLGSGLAILSRYPIVAASSEPYGSRHCAGFDCLSNKGVQHVRLMVPGVPVPVDLFNTHLNSQAEARVKPKRHGAAQALQRADLTRFIAENAGPASPAIIGGDFNLAGTPARLALLEADLHRFTMVHRYCATAPSCDVRISWDGDEPWIDTEDLQLFRSGPSVAVTPVRVEAMFDGSSGQPRLSDHDGFRVTYRLNRR